MSRFFFYTVFIFLTIYILAAFLLYFFQRHLLYKPSEKRDHPFQERLIQVNGAVVNVIVLNPGKREAILYFGGNAGAVAGHGEVFSELFADHTVYLVNYRGYGGSTGEPGEAAFYSDALSVYDDIVAEHCQVSVIGRSLGTGVATYLASQREIQKIALVTPYDSITNVAKDQYPFFPVELLLKERYESKRYLSQVKKREVLMLIAAGDRTIREARSHALAEAVDPTYLTMKTIQGTDHNYIMEDPTFLRTLQGFFYPDVK
ncbi:MAG TPA: alpha/beta hydrolase [Epsilonproteobacteria bacterium]|nr:alpha/beta hydrolase [Campylobacterota bacterium]